MTPISILTAAQAGDHSSVQEMLQGDTTALSDCDEGGCTALHLAAAYGHTEIVHLLIAAGAALNQQDIIHGGTPLHWAAVQGHQQIVIALLKAGADPNLTDFHGKTPLLHALDGFAQVLEPWCSERNQARYYGSISLILLQRATAG